MAGDIQRWQEICKGGTRYAKVQEIAKVAGDIQRWQERFIGMQRWQEIFYVIGDGRMDGDRRKYTKSKRCLTYTVNYPPGPHRIKNGLYLNV